MVECRQIDLVATLARIVLVGHSDNCVVVLVLLTTVLVVVVAIVANVLVLVSCWG